MIVPKNVSLCLTALAGLICLTPDNHVVAEGPALASLVKYNRDVRPILSENCFFCHGFDQGNRQADLRLDTQEGATADLGDYAAIVPGDPKNSELLTRIFTDDPDLKMPPADSVYALTDQQRETLRRWIEQGAHYEKHWAFRALQKPDVPEDKEGPQAQEGLQAIDAFLQQTWSTQNITPVAQASPRELIRRLSYDLRGLPPTLQEVRHFKADPSDQAFNALVEKWIDSLQYAEHQAVRWLDLVRWADSSGMVSDEPIASGAYRAYVIGAFQHNMPFDQFTIEQLAGDLLPEPTDQTLIASGYNRLVKTNSEAGVIDQEALYALKGEHVRALGTVWLGSTTGCAECHDHKYDPFTAKDYYSLAAFFDDLAETGVYMPGDRRVPLHYVYGTPTDTEQDAQLTARVAEIYADIHREDPTLDAQQPDWETQTLAQLQNKKGRSEFLWYPAVPPPSRIIEGKFAQLVYADRPARVVSASPDEFRRHLITESFTGYLSQDRLRSNDDAFFVDVYLDPDSPPKQLIVQLLRGAYGRKGWLTDYDETYYWGEDPDDRLQQKSSWHNPEQTKRLGDLPPTGVWTRLRIPKQKLLDVDFYKYVGMAWGQLGGTVAWADSGLQLRTDQATSLRLAETPTRKWEETPLLPR